MAQRVGSAVPNAYPQKSIAHDNTDSINANGFIVGRALANEYRPITGLWPFVADVGFQRFASYGGERQNVLAPRLGALERDDAHAPVDVVQLQLIDLDAA